MVESVFIYIDIKNDGYIDEQELINFYQNSDLPDILDGSNTPKSKANSFFIAVGCSNNIDKERLVKVEQLIEFYITQSLATESDREFKTQILIEYNLSNKEMDEYISYRYPNIKFKFMSSTSNTAISTSVRNPGTTKQKYKGLKPRNSFISDDSHEEVLFLHDKSSSDRGILRDDQGQQIISDTGQATSLKSSKSFGNVSSISSPGSGHKINQPEMSVPSSRRPIFDRRSGSDSDSPRSDQSDEETKGEGLNNKLTESRIHRRRGESPERDNTLQKTPVKKNFKNRKSSPNDHNRNLPASLGERAINELLVDFDEEWNDKGGEVSVDMRRRSTDPNLPASFVEKLIMEMPKSEKQKNEKEHYGNNDENKLIDKGNNKVNYDRNINEQNVNNYGNGSIDNSNGIGINSSKKSNSQIRTPPDDSLDSFSKTNDNDGSFADRITQDLQHSSVESLRSLMGTIMVTTYEQKREIEKLNKKIDRLCGLLMDDTKS
jgi:hypothetical protein